MDFGGISSPKWKLDQWKRTGSSQRSSQHFILDCDGNVQHEWLATLQIGALTIAHTSFLHGKLRNCEAFTQVSHLSCWASQKACRACATRTISI